MRYDLSAVLDVFLKLTVLRSKLSGHILLLDAVKLLYLIKQDDEDEVISYIDIHKVNVQMHPTAVDNTMLRYEEAGFLRIYKDSPRRKQVKLTQYGRMWLDIAANKQLTTADILYLCNQAAVISAWTELKTSTISALWFCGLLLAKEYERDNKLFYNRILIEILELGGNAGRQFITYGRENLLFSEKLMKLKVDGVDTRISRILLSQKGHDLVDLILYKNSKAPGQ